MTDPEEAPELVELNGHNVPAEHVDLFLSGRNGDALTDEQWDEQKRRLAIADDAPPAWTPLTPDDYFTEEPTA